jgi:hypothetical protein
MDALWLLLYVVQILFWPALIVIVIVVWRRRRRRARDQEERQSVAELTELVADARDRLRDVELRLVLLERRSEAPAAARVAPPALTLVEEAGAPPAPALPEVALEAAPDAAAEALPEPAAETAVETLRWARALETAAPPVEAPAEEPPAPAPLEKRLSESQRWRHDLEQRFIENWTGILGAVVVVAGVTFVGIYTAVQLAPFYRFLLTLAVAGALVAGSVALDRKELWRQFGGWLRSAGAAIALFACAAAGGLPGLGLQWIFAPLPALGLLLAGIAANLFLAWSGGVQVLATLHVLLSLVPLAIVPASAMSLGIASAVSLFGVALAARGRWDRHLAFVVGAYLLFHAIWFDRVREALDAGVEPYLAAGFAALVFGAAALVHHRRDCAQTAQPSLLQVGVHLAGWLLTALALFVYVPSQRVRGALLLVIGIGVYCLALRARMQGVPWLYRGDTLAAQAFVLLAMLSGFDLGLSKSLVLLFVLAETLGFRWLVPREQDAMIDRVADALPVVAAVLLALAGVLELGLPGPSRLGLAAVLLAGAALAVLGQRVLRAPPEAEGAMPSASALDQSSRSAGALLGTLAGVLVLAGLAAVIERPWFEGAALVAVGMLLVAWARLGRAGLQEGVTLALVGVHAVSWLHLLGDAGVPAAELTVRLGPLAALAGLGIWIARRGWIRPLAIVLAGITAGLAAYLYFDPVSPLIPGVAWLVLSLVALELANRASGRESLIVLLLGYGYLAAFAWAYAVVIIQAPAYIGVVSARLLIELFAMVVLGYWWLFRPREALAAGRSWVRVHPLFLELMLVGVAVIVVVEIAAQWRAVAWAVIALALLSAPGERLLDARARVYSLLFYWVSVAYMAVVLSALEVPSPHWFDQPRFTSLVAIALQVAYVAWAHRRLLLDSLELPGPMSWLARLAAAVGRRRNLYVYYPLFAGVAIFLYWRFDKSLLTLLWAAEAFVVFGLSAWLRENQFRHVALAGLALCLARLLLIDMAEANLALRGVVFIGVGSLMLGMNAIYNRYRSRFAT